MRRCYLLVGLLVVAAAAAALTQPATAAIVKDRTCTVSGSGDVTNNTDQSIYVSAKGEVKAAMIFVDFPDVQAGALDTQSVYDLFVPRSQRWFQEVSYGRSSLSVTPRQGWLRMPRPAAEYFPRGGEIDYDRYITEALRAADPSFDFSGFELVYIVPAPNSGHELGPAHFGPSMTLDGQDFQNYVTFGDDTMLADPASETQSELLVHETGHELSLPDYYSYDGGDDIHRNLGFWDPMGEAFLGNHFSAWSKRKIGWLAKSEFLCVNRGSTTTELRAADVPRGRHALFIRLSSTRAFIVEARRQRGFDSPICSEGVVVYLLDGRKSGDKGGLTVRPAQPDSGEGNCGETVGRFDRAPFVPGTTFRSGKVSVAVLNETANGYRVKVTKRR